jgi:hypothetical protein
MHAKDLHATDLRALRFALAITWPSTGLGICREMRTDTYSRNGKFFSGAPDARVRGTAHTIAHRHGSDRQRFSGGDLDEQLCCREHNPRHEQGRACKQQEIVEDSGHHIPHAHDPMLRRRARAAADVMGIPPTLRKTPDGSIGSPPRLLFLMTSSDYVLCPPVDPIRLPTQSLNVRFAPSAAMRPFRTHALPQTAFLFDHLVGAREQQR